MWIAGVVLLILSGGLVAFYFVKRKEIDKILSTETAKVDFLESLASSMTEGVGSGALNYFTEVKGKVVCKEPLISELAQSECVYYYMRVNRNYEETYYETDSQGHRQRKTRSGSETMSQNERSVPFYVNDGTGSIKVKPDGAKIISEKVLSRFEPASSQSGNFLRIGSFSFEISGFMGGGGDRRTTGYTFEENAIVIGKDIYVLGEATDREGELCIQRPQDDNNKFIVSTKSEEVLVKEGKTTLTIMMVGAIISALAGVGLIIAGIFKS
ncbi:MAG: E3 ubiquitin ligase family protein [Desulfobacterales bacterium]|nr:E3 ubiquitin ligase family protein [Desulfobacterales bacterium]